MASAWGSSWGASWGDSWGAVTLVEVPDVVGETQGDATTILEGDGFVVAVQTAYSSVVPAGEVISQVPTAGSEVGAGATVTITVSLGEAPPSSTGAGNAKRDKPRRITVEIDGEEFAVSSEAEAHALLAEAMALAEAKVDAEVTRLSESRPHMRLRRIIKRKLRLPEVAARGEEIPDAVQQQVDDFKERLRKLYEDAARSAEIGVFLRRKQQDDEDDFIIGLLL